MVGRDLSAFERLSWKATPYVSLLQVTNFKPPFFHKHSGKWFRFAEVTIAHWFQVCGPATPEELAEALSDVHDHFAALQERFFPILKFELSK